MTQIPGVHIETVMNPVSYTQQQIEQACDIAWRLQRGKLLLLEEPHEDPDP